MKYTGWEEEPYFVLNSLGNFGFESIVCAMSDGLDGVLVHLGDGEPNLV